MKRNLFILLAMSCLMVGCSQSPQQKIEALVRQEMPKMLIIPESYDPIESKIDSAFYPQDSPEIITSAQKLDEMLKQKESIEKEIENAKYKMRNKKSTMLIFSDYYDSFSKNNYIEAKNDYLAASKTLQKATKKRQETIDKILEQIKEFNEHISQEKHFIGYKVQHKYRAKSNADIIDISNHFFLIDENCEQIRFSYGEELVQEVERFGVRLLEFTQEITQEE